MEFIFAHCGGLVVRALNWLAWARGYDTGRGGHVSMEAKYSALVYSAMLVHVKIPQVVKINAKPSTMALLIAHVALAC